MGSASRGVNPGAFPLRIPAPALPGAGSYLASHLGFIPAEFAAWELLKPGPASRRSASPSPARVLGEGEVGFSFGMAHGALGGGQ